MKKTITVAASVLILMACNNSSTTATTTTDSANVSTTDASRTSVQTTQTNTAYSPSEGDVIYKEKKVMVWKDGKWVSVNKETKLENGVTVYPNGTIRKDNQEQQLDDGVVVTKSGDFLDRTGHTINNAWDSTKAGFFHFCMHQKSRVVFLTTLIKSNTNHLEKQYLKSAERLKLKLKNGYSWKDVQVERHKLTLLAIAIHENHHQSNNCELPLFGEMNG